MDIYMVKPPAAASTSSTSWRMGAVVMILSFSTSPCVAECDSESLPSYGHTCMLFDIYADEELYHGPRNYLLRQPMLEP